MIQFGSGVDPTKRVERRALHRNPRDSHEWKSVKIAVLDSSVTVIGFFFLLPIADQSKKKAFHFQLQDPNKLFNMEHCRTSRGHSGTMVRKRVAIDELKHLICSEYA